MPIFRFDLFDDLLAADDEGRELPDLAAARAYAIANIRQLAASEVLEGRLNLAHRIVISDGHGVSVETIYFRDVVSIEDDRDEGAPSD